MDGLSPEALAALQQHFKECEDGVEASSRVVIEPVNADQSSFSELTMTTYGSNEYWLDRWQNGQEAQEWFVVDLAKVWPYLAPVCEEHELTGKAGPHKAVLELGAGTSSMGLDLVMQHGVNGVVVTDIAEDAMRMQRERAAEQLGEEAAHLTSYVTDDACAMQFCDEQFRLVYDKGTNDCIRLNEDPELLGRLVSEVHRVLGERGYYVFVTCQHIPDLEPWLQHFDHIETSVVHQDGPATTNLVVLRKLIK